MKVLIIGTWRSGTTSLSRAIESQGFKTFLEPFNTGLFNGRNHLYPIKKINSYKNVLVKTLSSHLPKNSKLNIVEFYVKFIKEFDFILLLDRKDLNEHKESFLHMNWRLDSKESVMQQWDETTVPMKYRQKFKETNRYYELEMQKIILKIISKSTNIPITYYEQLYSNDREQSLNIIKSWNLNLDNIILNEELNPKYKLKIDKKIF